MHRMVCLFLCICASLAIQLAVANDSSMWFPCNLGKKKLTLTAIRKQKDEALICEHERMQMEFQRERDDWEREYQLVKKQLEEAKKTPKKKAKLKSKKKKKVSAKKLKKEKHKRKHESSDEDDTDDVELLADEFGVDLGKLRKRKKAKRDKQPSEFFDRDGAMFKPAPYKGMRVQGLVWPAKILPKMCNEIASDVFFPLEELAKVGLARRKSSAISFHVKTGGAQQIFTCTNEPDQAELKTKSEIFKALYLFGMCYLQVYPEKTVSFLEYLYLLTKMNNKLNVDGMLQLDYDLRTLFLSHPHWIWSQKHPEAYLITTEISQEKEFQLQNLGGRGKGNNSKQQGGDSRNSSLGRGRSRGGGTHCHQSQQPHKCKGTCNAWNDGNCSYGADCHWQHKCPTCNDFSHCHINCLRATLTTSSAPAQGN